VKRVLVRWLRYDVIVLDEVGYVPLAEIGAEFLFQVIAASRTGSLDRDHEPAVLGMDAGVFESAPVQSPAGSHHRPGAHHRDGNRVLSFPQNAGGTAEKESLVAFRASTELSRGRDSGRRPFLGAPARLSSDRTGGSVISTLEEKDSYDVGGAKSDGHGGAESSCQKHGFAGNISSCTQHSRRAAPLDPSPVMQSCAARLNARLTKQS